MGRLWEREEGHARGNLWRGEDKVFTKGWKAGRLDEGAVVYAHDSNEQKVCEDSE